MTLSLRQILDDLESRGYRNQFRAVKHGLRDSESGRTHPIESLVVEASVRVEGDSNPAEQTLVFAIRAEDDSIRGTYVVAFGPEMDPLDAEIVPELSDAPR